MDPLLSNLLYDHPELYEEIYPSTEKDIPRMAERLLAEHAPRGVRTLLDLGCGTGRHVEHFTGAGIDCVGVDYQDGMIAFARSRRPGPDFRTGDMRSLRLGRTFDAITCLGWALSNLHTNDDIARSVTTFATHARRGTLLFLHVPNAIATPEGEAFQRHFTIATPAFTATAEATYTLDRRHQLLVRRRLWRVAGQPPMPDHVRFRLLFPMELERYLTDGGFEVLGMYDNTDAEDSDLSGEALYVLARFGGRAS
ncbi:bifunctional 2-polyprenyl-6-hydroxyphenol methylase/3-demethylubiquinol 3-O-methyltransferase UbiG [Streptomyces sp. I05A-00742]|uniref:class I SAM-dependent methyltransferase n=1 Tax=Streptomyces sp. I05A-00742 TaxID=2732853 RepID=UPI0014882F72|nr:class I SAM-dependent methyltransferase [Streptomyces sp. I05A-00742]